VQGADPSQDMITPACGRIRRLSTAATAPPVNPRARRTNRYGLFPQKNRDKDFQEDATLLELRVMFEPGPWRDAENPEPVDVIRGNDLVIPTLSHWGAATMLVIILAAGLWRVRRRSVWNGEQRL